MFLSGPAWAQNGGGNVCADAEPQALDCGSMLVETIPTSAPSTLEGTYECGSPYAPLRQSGPDVIYSFRCPASGPVTMGLTGADCDVDLYVLDDTCDVSAGCIDGSTDSGLADQYVTFDCVADQAVYVVVEAFGAEFTTGAGACGSEPDLSYTLGVVQCPEDCQDGEDNNADGLVDCDDPLCSGLPECIEDCDDGIDNNDNGLADCSDPACFDEPGCEDRCPDDPLKTEPGLCGCGVPDTDSDGDGTPDCDDLCPQDREKTEPGACGCGLPDTDTDGDGTPDCDDLCPCLLYTSPSPRDLSTSRMPSSA